VESAIVMIAFVIVAATLAFVVLNMGMNTSADQESKIDTKSENIEDCPRYNSKCYALVLEKKIDELTIRLENMESQK